MTSGTTVGQGGWSGYSSVMQTKIEKIGDSFGVPLPKELLDACGFGTEATVKVQDKALFVTPAPRQPRAGWVEAIRTIPQGELDRDFAELKDFRETPDEWDATEWQWPEANDDEKA
jgi:antitoxin component of MazEF toxin-antitoxin module